MGRFRNDCFSLRLRIFLASPVSAWLDLAPIFTWKTEPKRQARVGARRFVRGLFMIKIHKAQINRNGSHGHFANTHNFNANIYQAGELILWLQGTWEVGLCTPMGNPSCKLLEPLLQLQ